VGTENSVLYWLIKQWVIAFHSQILSIMMLKIDMNGPKCVVNHGLDVDNLMVKLELSVNVILLAQIGMKGMDRIVN